MDQILKIKLGREVKDYLSITFGLICYALGWAAFLLPYQITTGGVTGISAIIYYVTGIEIQVSYFIINAVFLGFALKILGPKFSLKTIYAIFMLTFLLWLFQALLKNPNLIEEIVRKVSSAISKPLTVKVRIGFENEPVDIVEIAKRIEDAGAAALAVHGRTRQQYYSGTADWDTIRRVKEAITIPVIGNGDVDSPLKAEALVKQTGCDAVMVGRAVRGNPWLFRELNHYFRTGELLERPSVEEIREMILRHARKQIELKGEFVGIREMRKHVAWYTAGMRHSAGLRRESNTIESYEALEALLSRLA